MNADFWLDRWRTNQTGWHAAETNKHLVSRLPLLGDSNGRWTLVPLCGKSVDMEYLATQGRKVLGIDLSAIACRAFLEASGRAYSHHEVGGMVHFESTDIKLIFGDLFAIEPEELPPIASCYDRACLIALTPEQRRLYARWLARAMPEGAVSLLIAVEYPPGEKSGPPHSVPTDEVYALFEPYFSIELLERTDVLGDSPKYREWGVTSLHETVYALRRNEEGGQ